MTSRHVALLTSRRKRWRLRHMAAQVVDPCAGATTGNAPYDVEWGAGSNTTSLTSYRISNTEIEVSGTTTSNYVVILWDSNAYAVVAAVAGAYTYSGAISVADLTAIAIDVWGKDDSGHNLNNDSQIGAEVYPFATAVATYCYPNT